jgi:hypothetical protein
MAGAMAGVVLAFLAPSGPVPSPAPADVPRLIEQIKTSYGSSAVHAFQQIGQPAVPALIEVLSDHERRYQSLDVRGIDWLSDTRAYAETEACFGYEPCSITQYQMERRGGRWLIVSEETPPAM